MPTILRTLAVQIIGLLAASAVALGVAVAVASPVQDAPTLHTCRDPYDYLGVHGITCRTGWRLVGKLYYSDRPNRFTYHRYHCRRTEAGYGLTCKKGHGDRLKKFVYVSD